MVADSGVTWNKQVQVNFSRNLRLTAHVKPGNLRLFLNTSAHNTRHNNFPAFISIIKPTSFHRCPFHPIPARSRPSAARKTMRQRNDIVFNFLILLHFVVNKRYGRFEVFLIALGEINYFPPTEKMLPPSWAFTSKDFPKGSESQLK